MSNRERGAITAELVVALPAVMLIVALAVGTVSAQLKRVDLISSASILARAIARDEPEEVIDRMTSSLGSDIIFNLEESGDMVCVQLEEPISIPGIGGKIFDVSERQCARATGQ